MRHVIRSARTHNLHSLNCISSNSGYCFISFWFFLPMPQNCRHHFFCSFFVVFFFWPFCSRFRSLSFLCDGFLFTFGLLCPFCMWDWIVFYIWNRKKWNNNDPMTLLVDCLKAAWKAKGIRVKLKSTENEVKQRWEKSKIRQKQVSFSFWQQAPT